MFLFCKWYSLNKRKQRMTNPFVHVGPPTAPAGVQQQSPGAEQVQRSTAFPMGLHLCTDAPDFSIHVTIKDLGPALPSGFYHLLQTFQSPTSHTPLPEVTFDYSLCHMSHRSRAGTLFPPCCLDSILML